MSCFSSLLFCYDNLCMYKHINAYCIFIELFKLTSLLATRHESLSCNYLDMFIYLIMWLNVNLILNFSVYVDDSVVNSTAAFAQDLDLILRTYIVAHNHLYFQLHGIWHILLDSGDTKLSMHLAHRHIWRWNTYINEYK